MNILFILYGDFTTNTAAPLILFTKELSKIGHDCIISAPSLNGLESHDDMGCFTPYLYDQVLSQKKIFRNGRAADILHACTPRIGVCKFIEDYMGEIPTPLVFYLEDNEYWISCNYLNLNRDQLLNKTNMEVLESLPPNLSNPLEYRGYIGLADLVVLIQSKLQSEVPPWTICHEISWGIDLEFFSPRDATLVGKQKTQLGIGASTKVIVYSGGINKFTLDPFIDLCAAIANINNSGIECKLVRTGQNSLLDIEQLTIYKPFILDLGLVNRNELPSIMSVADIFVQPGRIDEFQDLRLPSKIPEFFGMGRPVIMPNVNIANKFRDDIDAVILKTGSPEEISIKCIEIFKKIEMANLLSKNARKIAENLFDIKTQAKMLEEAYFEAIANFNSSVSAKLWSTSKSDGVWFAFYDKALMVLGRSDQNFPATLEIAMELATLGKFQQIRTEGLSSRISAMTYQLKAMQKSSFLKRCIHKFIHVINKISKKATL